MWLLTSKTQNYIAGQQGEPIDQEPPYWPATQPAALNRPVGNSQKGGIGSTNDRYSILFTPDENDPPYVETYTRHIGTGFPGENGRELVGTYDPYDKVVGVYTQPSQRSVPEWQNPVYGPYHRDQLRPPAIGSENYLDPAAPTRPPVFETDFSTQTLTSDAAMVFSSDNTGYTGVDWNAYQW